MATHTCWSCNKDKDVSMFLNRGKYWSCCDDCIAQLVAEIKARKEARTETMCDLCDGTGYRMVDIGTTTIPDFEEIRCRCNPYPDCDVVEGDYDPPTNRYLLPSHLLAGEPYGSAYDDFHRFNDAHYNGL